MTKEQLPGGGTVFGIGRRKSQGQQALVELNQSISHLVQAANHAAKGAGATVGPRVQVARGYVGPAAAKVRDHASTSWGTTLTTLAPLAAAARDGAAQAKPLTRKAKSKTMRISGKKKQPRRRGSMMTGLLAAGVVAGLAGAVALRRRREQQEWAEYDPTRTLEPMRDEVDSIEVRTPSTGTRGSDGSAMAGMPEASGSTSTSTSGAAKPAGVRPTDKVPSVAEGAKDVSGRPTDDLAKALGKDTARTNGRR
ncbi:hypothetical protein V6V47_26570 [Micromonospora sp. CPCC 205539]|uniref:hypothetical protein n=1 Tax=Micromonospora sp. CPCC 205539 TaxID=3122408 RepID=UPI002FF19256